MELLERHAEIECLEQALAAARNGSGRVVLVSGEAGIGKTTLVRSFLETHEGSAEFLVGVCDDLSTPRPLSPIWDMSLDSSIAEALALGDRQAVHEVVLDLMRRSLRPTALVIEDSHWADEATLDLMRHLGRRIHDTHGLLIVTYRDDEVTAGHPLRPVLGDLPPGSTGRISLAPLSRRAVDLMAGDSDLAESIYGSTGGNPFFVTEMLATGGREVPVSILDSVLGRVARLSAAASGLVELLSVVPGRVEQSLVEDLVGDWTTAVDEAEQQAILELSNTHVMFRHELARRSVEQSLSAGRRRELHHRILSHLIGQDAHASLIVHHAVGAGDGDALLDHAPAAAEAATSVGSRREAYDYYETLQSVYPRLAPKERAELLHKWSVASAEVNDLNRAVELIDEAAEIWRGRDNPMQLGSALRWRSRVAWLLGDRKEAEAYADEAVAILEPFGPSPELAHAYSAQSQLAMLAYRPHKAIERAGRALETARPLGEDQIVAHALVNLGSSWTIGTYPENTEAIKDAIAFARRKRLWEEVVRGTVNYAWGALLARDLETAERCAVEAAEVAEDQELTAFSQYGRATLAFVKVLKGEWTEAEDVVRTVLSQPEIGPTTEILLGTVRGTLLARRGDTRASGALEEAWEKSLAAGELQRSGLTAAARAEHAWITGDHGSIPDLVGPDLARAIEVGSRWIAADLSMWLWLGGHAQDPMPDPPDPHSDLFDGEWEAAADGWKSLGMPYERALALGQGGKEALLEAISILDDLGAEAVAGRFRARLRDLGVRSIPRGPIHATRSNPYGLTPRQAKVAELLREGLSNPEIADRLFISRRTVESHVSAILTKLGVSSRKEAVAVVQNQ